MTRTTIRTLFVEDEPDVREIVNVALGLDPDFVLTTFGSSEDALDGLRGNTDRYDLALLDVNLPAMSGIDLHHRLRRLPGLETVKTVLITASILPRDKTGDPRGEVLGVIQKPFHPLRLASDLRAMLAKAGSASPER
jgi:CheY-like chemotaxis protein